MNFLPPLRKLFSKTPSTGSQKSTTKGKQGTGCGHTSVEEGLNAGCVECALWFREAYRRAKRQ